MLLVAGEFWASRGKDAGSARTGLKSGATEDSLAAIQGGPAAQPTFVKPS